MLCVFTNETIIHGLTYSWVTVLRQYVLVDVNNYKGCWRLFACFQFSFTLSDHAPVGVVEIPLFIHTLTPSLNRTGQCEVPRREFHEAVAVTGARALLDAGIIQIRHFQFPIHDHKLPRAKIQ